MKKLAGFASLAALIPSLAFAAAFNRPLGLGSAGSDVTSLQHILIAQSFLPADDATGYFGPLTQIAVQKYQTAHSIVSSGTPATTGYGAVGPKTLASLNGTTPTSDKATLIAALMAQVKVLEAEIAAILAGQHVTIPISGGATAGANGISLPPQAQVPPAASSGGGSASVSSGSSSADSSSSTGSSSSNTSVSSSNSGSGFASNSSSDTSAPSTPTNLSVLAVSTSQINLTWAASTDNVGVTGYNIYRNGTKIGSATTNSYSSTGLSASTNYSYTVNAYDAAGNTSAQSSSASATTQAAATSGGSGSTSSTSVYPNASNTGPIGVTLTPHSGDLTISTAGQVVSGLDINGVVTIAANNVTLKNCKVHGSGYFQVTIASGVSNATVENCDINGGGNGTNSSAYDGIIDYGSGNSQFLNNNIYNLENMVDGPADGDLIQGNYMHNFIAPGSPHYDGVSIDGSNSNITIRGNTIINDQNQTSAIMIDNYYGAVSGITVDGNLLGGAGYTIYDDAHFDNNPITNVKITNNRIQPTGYYGMFDFNGTTPTECGNVNDTTGAAIDAPCAGSTAAATAPTTPAGLSASAVSASQINLTWTASTDNRGVTGYNVYRGGTKLGTSATNSYSDTGLAASTNYSYTVSAYDAAGNTSAQSAAASATTQAASSGTTSTTTSTTSGTGSTTGTLGSASIGSTDYGDSGYINASRFTMGSSGGTAQSISVYIASPVGSSPNNRFQVAIYSDASGKPGSLIASSQSATITGNAWNTVPISASLTAGTAYWLAYSTTGGSSVNNITLNPGSSGQTAWTAQSTFGTWPTSFGSEQGTSANAIGMYVTFSQSSQTAAAVQAAPSLSQLLEDLQRALAYLQAISR